MYIFIFLILYFALTRIRFDLAVMLLIMVLPAYLIRFNILGIPFTMLEAMILIAFFSWFVFNTNFKNFIRGKYKIKDYLKNRAERASYPFGLELSLVLIISFIAVAIAGFDNEALGIWKAYFFEAILVYILVLNVFQKKIEKIIYSLAISAFGVSIFAIIQKFTGIFIANDLWRAEETRRVVSFFGYPNAVGLFLAPMVLILVGYLLSLQFRKKSNESVIARSDSDEAISSELFSLVIISFLVVTIITSIFAIYFARSEGALVGLVFSFIVFGLILNKWTRIITASLIIVGMGIVLLNPALKDYAIKKVTLMDFSGQIRRAQWAETWKMLKDGRIIQGAGLANYQQKIAPYHIEGIFYNDGADPDFHRHTVFNEEYRQSVWRPVEIYLYPHNIFLNFWTETGLLGMLLFIWIIIKSIYHLSFIIYHSKVNKIDFFIPLGILGAITVIMVHGLVDVPYFKNDLAIIFWLIIAMIGILKLKKIEKNNYSESSPI